MCKCEPREQPARSSKSSASGALRHGSASFFEFLTDFRTQEIELLRDELLGIPHDAAE